MLMANSEINRAFEAKLEWQGIGRSSESANKRGGRSFRPYILPITHTAGGNKNRRSPSHHDTLLCHGSNPRYFETLAHLRNM